MIILFLFFLFLGMIVSVCYYTVGYTGKENVVRIYVNIYKPYGCPLVRGWFLGLFNILCFPGLVVGPGYTCCL